MTTKVIVDAHAGWPVNVQFVDKDANGEWKESPDKEIVPANETREFFVYDTRRLIIEEGERT